MGGRTSLDVLVGHGAIQVVGRTPLRQRNDVALRADARLEHFLHVVARFREAVRFHERLAVDGGSPRRTRLGHGGGVAFRDGGRTSGRRRLFLAPDVTGRHRQVTVDARYLPRSAGHAAPAGRRFRPERVAAFDIARRSCRTAERKKNRAFQYHERRFYSSATVPITRTTLTSAMAPISSLMVEHLRVPTQLRKANQ